MPEDDIYDIVFEWKIVKRVYIVSQPATTGNYLLNGAVGDNIGFTLKI